MVTRLGHFVFETQMSIGGGFRMIRLLALLSLFLLEAHAEIVPLDLILDASSEEVHYVRGWLEAPAVIDLSKLKMLTTPDPNFGFDDDDFDGEFTDDDDEDGDSDEDETSAPSPAEAETPVPTPLDDGSGTMPSVEGNVTLAPTNDETGGGNGTLAPGGDDLTEAPTSAPPSGGNSTVTEAPTGSPPDGGDGSETAGPTGTPGDDGNGVTEVPSGAPVVNGSGGDEVATTAPSPAPTPEDRRVLESNGQRVMQVIHFVLFLIPDDCKQDMWGNCDWSALGVGAIDDLVEGDISYCCSEDTASRGICMSSDIGKIIVDPVLFGGQQKTLDVPTTINTEFNLTADDSVFKIGTSGDYVLLMGNCYDDGLDVLEIGSMEWKAENRGYVPGHLYGLMLFYAAITAIYFLLVVFYFCGMRMFQDNAIPIQRYILATMILGFLELTARAADLGYWNLNGNRSVNVLYASLALGAFKRGIANCLGVMVAKGWGIVRESLGLALAQIVLLGLIYTGITGFRDFTLIVANEDVQTLSVTEEDELWDIASILTIVIIILDGVFYFWILNSLNATSDYLRNMSQTSKLRRHLRLRCLMLTSMTIAAAWLIFTIVEKFLGGILRTDQKWFFDGVMQLNYLLILIGVAMLWRPNANAKDYAMQMQIPTMGEDDENDLELSCVVPSAGDMDYGNDPDHPNGIRADAGHYS